ncbi:MAG: hypothetical protein HND56_09275 [Pseudomonadota bacterium]|nr:hypothetical protein [Pseudomonadota bacterium]QKK05866.1 MAG: hypothetical protein HND56_09275 [Pseudomonadota bacterium]
MALDEQASKGTKFGATPDVETHDAGSKKDQDVTVTEAPATPKMADDEPTKPESEDKKPEADAKKPDEPKKDEPKNEGPKPPKKDDNDDGDKSGEKSQKNDNDDETKNLLKQIRDGVNPEDNRHPLMKQLDQDMKAYSNRTAEFRAGYEFGYKVSYGLVRAVEMAFKGMKWAATLKKAEAGVTPVQGSAAGLSGDSKTVMEQAGVSQSQDGAAKKDPEQKKDQDKKPDSPKKDESPVAKSKFGNGVVDGVKTLVDRAQKKDSEAPKQKQPRKPKGKSFG